MKKQVAVLGIVVLLACIGLSGCTSPKQNNEQNQKPNSEKIIGQWIATSPDLEGSAQFNFYANGSYYFVYPDGMSFRGQYTMVDNLLTVQEVGRTFECTFSENDTKVTCYLDGELNTILTKQ
jgi:hypothetical protein